ncbi:serine/threonine-protein kinase [Vitiosangium sp. GDMCC 1.1324]|uniref:serine/threonine protein kinase n=1 Tax=Vitiosangium sp. (strain GDMCC 1.1324) TaxID=2138576 RepID=UPI000D380825|nr:serine/threonine-protein kinase [Vitiosangium sp. GDMCC 1.1324]PTL83767.1 serine/threonine protein kinase [Vitiosangium sp. GDMCC 1.1324]
MSESVEGQVPAEQGWQAWRPWRPWRGMEEWEEAWSPAPGLRVDGYRLEARLGEGGQGSVYRARRGGRLYAIKFFFLASNDWAWRELEIRLRLRRVGSLEMLGCGVCPPTRPRFVYLVMPYVRGRPLYDWAREKNVTARDAARMVREMARQLVDVHAAGVVHRDIKGANVLVRKKDGMPVLVDFGVGTYVGAPEITNPMALPGTRHYRSPEALRFRRERAGDHSPARTSDDLWALGVLLYWLLTGSHPFDTADPREDEGALADIILKHEPEPPHVRNPRVPRALSELCLRMLEKSLQARFPDARAVCAELEAVLAEADGTWDVPLCEAWGPEEATTPQEEGLDLGDWLDKARRLKLYARLHPRRGRPYPLAEASTIPGPPEAPPPGERGNAADTSATAEPPRTRGRPWRTVAWVGAALALGLVGLIVLLRSPAIPAPEEPSTTSEVFSAPTMLEVTKPGQEVASESKPPEVGGGAAPSRDTTPAPVASATPRKDGTRVKTPQQPPPRQQKQQSTMLDGVSRTCVLVWVAGQLACASPEPQVRPIVTTPTTRMPPPAECPAGSAETMKQVGGLGIGARTGVVFVIDGEYVISQRITVHPGQAATLTMGQPWGKFPAHTRFFGQLLLGEGRVYGRFTQARTPDGLTYSVCFDLYDSATDGERGVWMEPGSRQDAAIIFSSVRLQAVKRFE